MMRVDEALQARALDVGIDSRRRDVGVAQHRLHAAQIGAVVEQVARERMAQHVRRKPRRIEAGASASSFTSCPQRRRVRCPPRDGKS